MIPMSAENLRSSIRFALTSINAEIAIIIINVRSATELCAGLQPEALSKETTLIVPLKFLKIAIVSLLLSCPIAAHAQSQKTDIRPNANRLMGDKLRTSFKGKTHSGAYNFTEEGQPTRFYEEIHGSDGRISYTENGRKDPGTWLIMKNMMCYLYDAGDMPGGCFRVYRVANCYYFYSDRDAEREDELDRDYWIARSVVKGEQPQCEVSIS